MNRTSAAFAHSYHIRNGAAAIDARVFGADEADANWAAPKMLPSVHSLRQEYVAASRTARKVAPRRSQTGGGRFLAPVAIVMFAAATMTVLGARERVVGMAPAAAPVFAAIGVPVVPRGLAIEDVHARLGDFSGRKVMVIDGAVVNLRSVNANSPDLRIALRGKDGRELYVWTTRAPKSRLAKAERVHFAARLEAPPDGVEDAAVSFAGATEGS